MVFKKTVPAWRAATLLGALMLITACATTVRYEGVSLAPSGTTHVLLMSDATRSSIAALTAKLKQLNTKITQQEAATLASEAHIYPMHLANVWQISSSPLIHNILRNYNQREYGLCIDWTYAMRQRMQALGLASFDWHWGIANQGSDLFKHSTLVVTAKGALFEHGIVLDPWRNSGQLYWAPINQDPSYTWKPYTEPSGWTPSRIE